MSIRAQEAVFNYIRTGRFLLARQIYTASSGDIEMVAVKE